MVNGDAERDQWMEELGYIEQLSILTSASWLIWQQLATLLLDVMHNTPAVGLAYVGIRV